MGTALVNPNVTMGIPGVNIQKDVAMWKTMVSCLENDLRNLHEWWILHIYVGLRKGMLKHKTIPSPKQTFSLGLPDRFPKQDPKDRNRKYMEVSINGIPQGPKLMVYNGKPFEHG